MCSLGLFIGIISGLVGVGGGEFLVPMFLSVGFQHQKSSATSSCLIALATACDAINYFRSRELQVRASSAFETDCQPPPPPLLLPPHLSSQPFVLYVPWLYFLPLLGALLGKLQVLLLHLHTFPCTVSFHAATSDFQVFVQSKQARVAACVSLRRHKHLLRVGVRAGGGKRSKGAKQCV